ncbi:type II secretion system F family protein [Candidatus Campbellbacteria bacterium]|nr:MAG: type II secretion system F family protein [Candidatus Campbellbacteria bacterium]
MHTNPLHVEFFYANVCDNRNMHLKYKAVSTTGEVYEKTGEAEDSFALAKQLSSEGETLISANEIKEKSWLQKFNLDFSRIKLTEKITFAKNLATMVDAGLTVSRGISIMEKQSESRKFRETLSVISSEVQKGTPLSAAFEKFPDVFSTLFIAMVRAGEESGKLGESLRITAEQMDRSFALRRRIRGAMMYPTIIMTLMVIIGILMLMYVVPTLTSTFKEMNVDLPMTTQFIVTVSDGLAAHPLLYIGGMIGFVLVCVQVFRTKKGKRLFETAIMHMPVIKGLVQQTNSARMSRTFASLLSSGVDVVSAITITTEVLQNSYYKAVLLEAETEIQKGTQLSAVFARYPHLYPPMVTEMVAVGEETGKVPDMFLQIATFFETEVDQRTKDMSTIIEPVLMVIIGAAVGFFAISMISPIYSLSSGI